MSLKPLFCCRNIEFENCPILFRFFWWSLIGKKKQLLKPLFFCGNLGFVFGGSGGNFLGTFMFFFLGGAGKG